MLAYLVIREGVKWTDVFRLIPGQTVTIGRAPTNQIVIQDDRCSRYHAEIYLTEGRWTLRDLDSRNGTTIDNHPVAGEHTLAPGEVVRIGRTQLAFVHDLSKAFPDSSSLIVKAFRPDYQEPSLAAEETQVAPVIPAISITQRVNVSRLLEPQPDDVAVRAEMAERAIPIFRHAFQIAGAQELSTLVETALDAVLVELNLQHGAVFLVPRESNKDSARPDLDLLIKRTPESEPLADLPLELSAVVLSSGDGVTAEATTKSEADAKPPRSYLCVPIAHGGRWFGLLYAYRTEVEPPLGLAELDIAVAIARSLAVTWQHVERHDDLVEQIARLREEGFQLRQQLGVQGALVGKSLAFSRVADAIARAAEQKSTVLIRGETGVGKDLIARAVHQASPRANAPFVWIHCAAWPEEQLEQELFGVEAGRGDQGSKPRLGKFELAQGGTLLLDEINELSPTLQARVLRFLEGHGFERVGGSRPVRSDVRLIAASSRDLDRLVADGKFRHDLYLRLQGIEIVVPALHRRPEDIPELAYHFLEHFSAEVGRRVTGFTSAAIERLSKYRWPGNVRELKNIVERAVTIARTELIDAADLMIGSGHDGEAGRAAPVASLAEVEKRHILSALEQAHWNKTQAADWLGIEPSMLDRKIQGYELLQPGEAGRG